MCIGQILLAVNGVAMRTADDVVESMAPLYSARLQFAHAAVSQQ